MEEEGIISSELYFNLGICLVIYKHTEQSTFNIEVLNLHWCGDFNGIEIIHGTISKLTNENQYWQKIIIIKRRNKTYLVEAPLTPITETSDIQCLTK